MKPEARPQQPVAIAATRGDRRVLALLSGSLLLLLALLLLP